MARHALRRRPERPARTHRGIAAVELQVMETLGLLQTIDTASECQ
jgi:hypothetical protein